MKTKILLKVLRFSLLPTLVTVLLILVGFFSFTETLNFVTSNSGWAIFVRVLLFIAEVLLVIIMYAYYDNEERLKNIGAEMKIHLKDMEGNNNLYNIPGLDIYSKVSVYKTQIKNLYLLEKN